tara:strand:- start:80 stop:826 length:747 start_codon:yes stop_codon:yes gene_type:complete
MATLLDLTQNILAEMDGDTVNSIFDTEESESVAKIIISTFNAMEARSVWPNSRRLVSLVPSGDNSKPTHMSFAEDIKELSSINYDKRKLGETRKRFLPVEYKYPDDFLRLINNRNTDSSTVTTVTDSSGISLSILNNQAPSYYTSFDDSNLIFDSYDSEVDTTLQASKVQAVAYIMRVLPLEDGSVIDTPPDALPGLQEEALSRAQSKLRQFQDVKSEQESGRQMRYISRKNWITNKQTRYPNYGRKK